MLLNYNVSSTTHVAYSLIDFVSKEETEILNMLLPDTECAKWFLRTKLGAVITYPLTYSVLATAFSKLLDII